jgi:hypothetical protein
MRAVLVMVTNMLGEQSLQMAFIQRNNMVQQVSSYSFPPTAPRCHSAREIGRKFAWGMILMAFTAAITSNPN